MAKVHLLDELVINQIAAGEVVENPASVVKELVENSLDAQANHIVIEITGGGRQCIRISDDGCGMSLEDAQLALQRHATSKLTVLDDLEALMTKGFRGEALPSIASISKMLLLTSTEEEGHLLSIEGGKLLHVSTAAKERGTTIEIKNLFFNVPVRKKYQRSPAHDVRMIDKMLSQIALAHPHQGFQLFSDGKLLWHVQPQQVGDVQALRLRIETLMGRQWVDASVWIDFEKEGLHVRGFVGQPQLAKRNRSGQSVWVNQRPIVSSLVAHSVKSGLGTLLQEGLFPSFCLFLELPGTCVDVNVHPQKKEVRFCEEEKVRNLLMEAIYYAFHGQKTTAPMISHLSMPAFQEFESQSYAFFQPSFREQEATEQQEEFSFVQFQPRPQVVALIKGYIVLEPQTVPQNWSVQEREGLAFLDQRLAHERILLELLQEKEKESSFVQPLLIPKTMELDAKQCALLLEHQLLLKKVGIDLKAFGENTIVVEALPAGMEEEDLESLIIQLADDLRDLDARKGWEEKVLLKLIQHTALKRERRITLMEAHYLLDGLMQCSCPTFCPRGRPIVKMVGGKQLEKW